MRGVEPAHRRGLHLRRGGGGHALEAIEVGLAVAAEGQALGQDVGAAAEPAQRFDAADEVRERAALRPLQLRGRRPFGEEGPDHGVDLLLDHRRIDAGLEQRLHVEGAGDLAAIGAGVDLRHQVLLVDQPPIEPRALRAAQHAGRQRQQIEIGVAPAGRVIGAIHQRLRHAILGFFTDVALEARDPLLGAAQRRARRDPVEVLLHQLERALGGDVAGQRQHAVVRAVVGAIPLLDVLERRRVEVRHAADGRPAVGMRGGVERLAHPREGLRVRLVLALALLVLHHAALALQALLRDPGGEEPHAIGLEEERPLERRHRHVLEEVRPIVAGGAVAVVGAEVVHGLAEPARMVLAAVEEEVLEQVREAGLAALLVARADVVPEVHRDDRRRVILVDDEPQPVVERELLVGDPVAVARERRAGCRGRGRGLGRRRLRHRSRSLDLSQRRRAGGDDQEHQRGADAHRVSSGGSEGISIGRIVAPRRWAPHRPWPPSARPDSRSSRDERRAWELGVGSWELRGRFSTSSRSTPRRRRRSYSRTDWVAGCRRC